MMKIDIKRIQKQAESTYKKYEAHMRNFYNINKGKKAVQYKIIGAALALILVLSVVLLNGSINASLQAYEIQTDGQVLAVVRAEEDFEEAMNAVKQELEKTYKQEVIMIQELEVIEVKADEESITDRNMMIRNIRKQLDLKVKAFAISVNGEDVVVVRDQSTADEILATLKAPFLQEDEVEKYEKVDFSEEIEIKEIATEIGALREKEDALNLIITGTDEEKIHEVQSGESAWTIAGKYDLSVSDIEKANPEINSERLQIGQEISLIIPKPYINVRTLEFIVQKEIIPFDTEYEKTSSLYEGDRKITIQGVEGEKEVQAYIVRENGIEIDKEILYEEILLEPKMRVIAEGTEPRPRTVATGVFANPTRGRLTSGFGTRWGRRHEGIDVAGPTGTAVNAADAGLVSFAGYNGAYGNLVIINHENGYQTYYAHNSSLLVKKGDRVYKGEQIAKMGSTGRSTGPHLHFEVRKNGSPVNPLSFVKY
ncbi:peptidase M23B [Alkaliphilus metalliredigens QYMF]|uniref:Peptidase M23B n=1 Tax=Alkaliphilus metalliredigens (strain QYMF) TaxID=293826 RepID=A6TXA9_ALKMQ|nr:M23 family metallopeptidase [Alkaliphilus metalliredigens]ABR50827.1 peptidase M23B [Alkaliphilus metalliredigens QYMF]